MQSPRSPDMMKRLSRNGKQDETSVQMEVSANHVRMQLLFKEKFLLAMLG